MIKTRWRNFFAILVAAILCFILLAGLMYTGIINEYIATLLTLSGIFIIVALGLNLISGFTGQLALGHAGLMSMGAYTTAVLIMQFHVPMIIAIFMGGAMAALFGLVIGAPTLRLKGDYLAITTLGFGEVIRVILVMLEKYTNGAAGLYGIPPFYESDDLQTNYIVKFIWVYVFVIGAIIIVKNLINSSTGLALKSIREDEVASNAMGINTSYYKIMAFTVSAALAGIGGGLYAIFIGYLNPQMFTWTKSVDLVVIVVLGGMGSITGTIIAGIAIIFALDMLWWLQDWRLVIYGLILIILMRFRPQGLMGKTEFSLAKLLDSFTRKKGGEIK